MALSVYTSTAGMAAFYPLTIGYHAISTTGSYHLSGILNPAYRWRAATVRAFTRNWTSDTDKEIPWHVKAAAAAAGVSLMPTSLSASMRALLLR